MLRPIEIVASTALAVLLVGGAGPSAARERADGRDPVCAPPAVDGAAQVDVGALDDDDVPRDPTREAPLRLGLRSVALDRLATRFSCRETVTVERHEGGDSERFDAGTYDYLLTAPRRARKRPFAFGEEREPKPRRRPWNGLPQPVPLAWLDLQNRAAASGLAACEGTQPERCRRFESPLGWVDGTDPREWQGRAFFDEAGRLTRLEAQPANQGEPGTRFFNRSDDFADTPGGSGFGTPSFSLDGAVEELHCEASFTEQVEDVWLPQRVACHRDRVGLKGKLRRRWSLVREYDRCRLFDVETDQEIDPVGASEGPSEGGRSR